jgi:hypothetical protein
VFETLSLPSLDIVVLIARAVLLVGAFCVFAVAFIRWRAADARSNAQLLQYLERTFAEVRSLHETIAVMGARIETLSERSESRPAPSIAAAPRGYDIAARLAKNGTDADGLIANCGLTRQEADLLVRLHGAKRADVETAPAARLAVRPVKETHAPAPRQLQVPVLAVPTPEIRKPSPTRRRGSLVSAVG